MPDLSAVARILEDYPMYAFLLGNPEVGPLLAQAVDPNRPWSQTRFENALRQTNWYKSRSAGARAWEILANTDPGEAAKRYNSAKMQVATLSTQFGINLSPPEWDFITMYNLSNGIEIGSPEFMVGLRDIAKSQFGTRAMVQGSIQGNMNDIFTRGKGQYFIRMPDQDIYNMAVDKALGFTDDNAINYRMQEYASSMYPHLRPMLDQGQTMADLFSGHLQTLGEEWEIDPGEVDVFSPTMQKLISMRDPNTGQTRASSLYEAKVAARKDDKFYSTSRWRQMDASITNSLLQAFGKRAA